MTDVNIILFGMPSNYSLINEINRYYSQVNGINVEIINSMEEVIQFVSSIGNAIFLFKIENKKDLTNAVAVLKSHKRLVKNGFLKPASISFVTNNKVEKILTKYGCVDQLDPGITAKTLSFKIDFWARALNTLIKNEEANQELRRQKELSKASKENKTNDFVFGPPLMLRSDMWILKSEKDYKKILKRWMVKFLGPSPHIGQWIELDKQPGDREPTWRFIPKDEDNAFILEDGAWFFYGDRPEFEWDNMRWTFTGDTPHLYFYSREGNVYSRLKYSKRKLFLTENSDFALTKEQEIIDSCEANYEYKKTKASNTDGHKEEEEDDSPLDINNPNKLLDRLEKNNSAIEENLVSDPFGKKDKKGPGGVSNLDDSIPETSRRSLRDNDNPNDPFRSKKEVDEISTDSNLEGIAKTDKLQHNPLSGKAKTDHLDRSPYEGKSSTDDLGASKKQEKLGVDELDRSPLEMKSKTDQISTRQEEKAKTQNLGPSHYSSQQSLKEEKRDPLTKHTRLDPYEQTGELKRDQDSHYENEGPKKKLSVDELRRSRLEFDEDEKDYVDEEQSDHLGSFRKKNKKISELRRDSLDFDEDEEDYIDEEQRDHLGSFRKKNKKINELRRDRLDLDDDDFDDIFEEESLDHLKKRNKKRRSIDELDREPIHNFDEDELDDAFEDDDFEHSISNPFKKKAINELDRDSFEEEDEDFDEFEHRPAGLESNPLNPPQGDKLFKATNENLPNNEQDSAPEARTIGSLGEYKESKPPEGIAKSRDDLLNMPTGSNLNPFGTKKQENQFDYDFDEDYHHLGEIKPKALRELDEIVQEKEETSQEQNVENPELMPGMAPEVDKEDKANEILELLDGGLTEGADNLGPSTSPIPKGISEPLKVQQPDEVPEDEVEKKSKEPFIKHDGTNLNFESGEIRVTLRQESKSGNMLTFLCKFDDLFGDELMVSIPKNSVNNNSKVLIKLSLEYDNRNVTLETSGKIVDIEPVENEPWDMLVIELKNLDKEKVDNLMKLYEQRQASIHDFMKRAKGY